jgi:hypothetical protein
MNDIILLKKTKIEKHEAHLKTGVNLCALEDKAVPASLVAPVVLLLSCDKSWERKEGWNCEQGKQDISL